MAEGTWIDAFVTKPDKVEGDSVFMGSVMTVKPARGPQQNLSTTTALMSHNFNVLNIVNESTHWISPRWFGGPDDSTGANYYTGNTTKYNDFLNLKEGDLIYIGHNLGATTVRTIMERKVFYWAVNRTGERIVQGTTSQAGLLENAGNTQPPAANTFFGGNKTVVAYRVDVPINATKLPDAGGTYTAVQDHSNQPATLETQQNHTFHDSSMQIADRPDAKYWCPLYKLNNVHFDSRLILPLDHGVKALHCVKLIAYSSNNKSLPGYLHFHEFAHDDYVMLGIKELPASLLSNESTARGAFAALHISDSGETYEREPAGIATQYVNPGASNVRQLTLELTNRKGEPAHLGRLHLWFKLLVTHG